MTTNTNENTVDNAVDTAETAAETNLTIKDLTVALQLIQVTGARGAIRPEEMTVVGELYQKLYQFLVASGAITTENPDSIDQQDADNQTAQAETE